MAKIVIDAGHGGADWGATYNGRMEKDDNLRMALAVGNILKSRGHTVIFTRDADVFVPLLNRSYISNTNNADMFISLHRNAHTNTGANGVENFVRLNPSARELEYAQNVLNKVVSAGVQRNRGVSREDFSVLTYTYAPAQLLELGFITNAVDNELFDRNFQAYASAIANGILDSLGEQTVSSGDATIKNIQQTLNSRYGTGLKVDGFFGANTLRGLIRGFQYEINRNYNKGIAVDGIWGAQTKSASPILKQGSRGNLVWILQAILYARNFKTSIDGNYGADTARTVRNFQLSRGLTADGIAGPNTFEALFK